MEGSSSTAQAAAAALVKNTGVAEADVVLGGGSRRGGATSGRGLVLKAADEEEHGFGGATVPDLNVQLPAEDPLYNSASSDATSDAEVSKYNVASYENKIEEKIWEEGLDAYMNKNMKYYCKFHPNKQVPRDGSREGLVAHAKTVKPNDLHDKANHAALIKVLEYFGQD
ncbi:hypothetical protein ACQ4PT_062577 [Festuca glaucescens]